MSFSVTVSQPFSLVATNSLTGIVTAVGPGGEVDVGEQLYAVAGHGAYAVAGSTPFYRDLALKDSGQDVVDRISLAERDERDRPRTDVTIDRVELA